MTERETFVAWLEKLKPGLPTTHDVQVAWQAWQARAALQELYNGPHDHDHI